MDFKYVLLSFKLITNDLKKQAKELGIGDQIKFHGYVSNARVRKELQNHTILLATSVTASDDDKEGLPNTILEAMASGVPVIASDHAAIPEAVHHKKTGLLVPERESEAIASTVIELLDQNLNVEKIRQNARQLIEEKHSLEQLVKRY